MTAFKTVVLDVDSTLCGSEGIDWLASLRSVSVAAEIVRVTQDAMEGRTTLEAVYGARLALVAPTRAEVEALGREYLRTIAPGAIDAISQMIENGVSIHLLSGGLLQAVRMVGAEAGIGEANVHAVEIFFTDNGSYSSFDTDSPLTRQFGKRDLIAMLKLERPVLMVGDGITDAEARPAVDSFAAFTGFATREKVVAQADHSISDFQQLLQMVIG